MKDNLLGLVFLFMSTTAVAGTELQIRSMDLSSPRHGASATEEIRIALYKGGAKYIPMHRGDAYRGEEITALDDVETNKLSVVLSAKSSASQISFKTKGSSQAVFLRGAIAEELFRFMDSALKNGADFKKEPGGDRISGMFIQCQTARVTACRFKVGRE